MAATLLPAILTKYDALTASGFASSTVPPAYHDEAPQVTAAGAQLRPPYVVVSVEPAGEVELYFDDDDVEDTRVTFKVYTVGEAALDLAVSAIRFNGQAKSSNAGFDNATLPAFTDGTLLSFLIDRTPTKHHEGVDRDGKNVYRADLTYTASVQRS